MKTFLIDVKNMLFKDKLYLVLGLLVLCFYVMALLAHQRMKNNPAYLERLQQETAHVTETSESELTAGEIEERLKQNPKLALTLAGYFLFLFAAFAGGIGLSATVFWRWYKTGKIIDGAGETVQIPWGASEVAKVVILFFFYGIGANVVLTAAKVFFFDGMSDNLLVLVQAFLLDILAALFIVWVVRRAGFSFRQLVGFNFPRVPGRDVFLGASAYLVVLPVFSILLAVLIGFVSLISYEPPPHPLVNVLMKEEALSWQLIFFSLFLACVVGPVVEEIFFRGFLYPALKKYWGLRWSMLTTAGLFAVVHYNVFAFLPIFFLGLVLTYLYEKRRNLVPSIVLHVIHNSVFISFFFVHMAFTELGIA